MDNQKKIYSMIKAIAYTENGGKPSAKNEKKGKTGESKSIFQFEPATWKEYSKQVFGHNDVPMTPDTETAVVQKKVSDWYNQDIKNGHSPEDATKMVFSRWNAGVGEPTAYTGKFSDGSSSSGINPKYGVKYDVPGYVNKAQSYYDKFSNSQQSTKPNTPTTNNPAPATAQNGTIPGMLPTMAG